MYEQIAARFVDRVCGVLEGSEHAARVRLGEPVELALARCSEHIAVAYIVAADGEPHPVSYIWDRHDMEAFYGACVLLGWTYKEVNQLAMFFNMLSTHRAKQ